MCPVSNFWSAANSGQTMLQSNTTGDTQGPDPTRFPGSSVGAVPANFTSAARAVYPVYDGVSQVSGVRQSLAIDPRTGEIDYARYPATFWSNLDVNNPPTSTASLTLSTAPTDFTNWHSAFQAEYISRASSATPPAYIVGTSASTASAIYMLDDENRPINLLALTLSDYAKLTDTERTRFNANLVASGHLDRLGLSTTTADRNALLATLNAAVGEVASSSLVAAGYDSLFTDQLQMLIDKVSVPNSAFSKEKIETEVNEILGRYKVVEAFLSAPRRSLSITISGEIDHRRTNLTTNFDFGDDASSSNLVRTRVNSLDEGATMDRGITTFIRAETEILNMKQRREIITENATYRDPNLDVPNLIFQLQLLYEAEAEGVVDAGTEEFRQLHKLLEDYNVMQQLLGTTLASFDTSKNDDKRRFMNIGGKDDGGVDDKQAFRNSLQNDVDRNDYDETYSNGATSIDVEASPLFHWSLLADYSDPLRTLFEDYTDLARSKGNTDGYKLSGDVTGKLNRTEMLAFSMFVDEPWATQTSNGHPIESLYGAERPKFDLVDQSSDGAGSLKLAGKNTFDQYQTALSNTITILNQQNQIKQNEIENATKQQNRHFELGNNALRKMNDLLLMIGRG